MGIDYKYSSYYFDVENNIKVLMAYDEGRRSFDYDKVNKVFWDEKRNLKKGIEVAMRYKYDFGGELIHELPNGQYATSYTSFINQCPAISVGENLFIFRDDVYTAMKAPLFFVHHESESIKEKGFPISVRAITLWHDELPEDEFIDVYKQYLEKLLPKRIVPAYLDQVSNLALNFNAENIKLLWELLRGNWREILILD